MFRTKSIRFSFFPVMVLHIAGILNAQNDSIKIQLINVHGIVNGKQTPGYYTKNQKTLSMDEQLIREVNFNDSTKQIQDYTFYFYRDKKLFSEENYNKQDSLQWIMTHTYNKQGKEAETRRLTWVGGKPVPSAKTIYEYDTNGNVLLKKDYLAGKRPYAGTTYTYESGKLIKEEYKAGKSPDSVKYRTVLYQYFPDGKVKLKDIHEKHRNKEIVSRTEVYFYNSTGNLEKIEIRDSAGQIILAKYYVYYPEGGLYRYFEQDKEGKMLCFHTYAYRKHRINLGTQKSYFDNP